MGYKWRSSHGIITRSLLGSKIGSRMVCIALRMVWLLFVMLAKFGLLIVIICNNSINIKINAMCR